MTMEILLENYEITLIYNLFFILGYTICSWKNNDLQFISYSWIQLLTIYSNVFIIKQFSELNYYGYTCLTPLSTIIQLYCSS